MAKLVFSALLLSICAVASCQGWIFGGCSPFWSASDWQKCTSCTMFSPKEVTLRVRNVLKAPTFEETVTLSCTRYKFLFSMMTEAADANSVFRFSAKYYNADLGFFIEAINGVAGVTADKTWWKILDGNNTPTSVGVSSYIPEHGETVTFNFTQGWEH